MALLSPGVEVTVIDESQYTPTAAGTIPYVLLATAQDKQNPSGTTATATTAANAEKLVTVTSQRELVSLFGTPTFQVDASDNPINGDERNEYGLLAAYSALGVTNRIYVQRANVNLAELEGTSIRPTGSPADGTYWLDVSSNTNWGIYRWDEDGQTFTLNNPTVITSTTQLSNGVPLSSIGAIGDFAVVATSTSNPVYYKNSNNNWVLVGSDDWTWSVPTITGAIGNPSNLSIGMKLVINSTNVELTGTTVQDVRDDINGAGITGVRADVYVGGELRIFAAANATSDGSTVDGQLKIGKGTTIGGTDGAIPLGLFDSALDGSANVKTLAGPTVQFSSYRDVPAWRTSDTTPRPYGSVWFKTSATGNGANWGIKEYDSILDSWVLQTAPLYESDNAAIYGLDPVGGGGTLAAGSLYVKYDTLGTGTGTFKLYRKSSIGQLTITGDTPSSPFVFTAGNSFTMEVSVPASDVTRSATITLSGTTANDLVGDILAADLPNVVASVSTSGAITISHLAGGTIKFTYITGTPLTEAGIINDNDVQTITAGSVYLASPWRALTYTYSTTAPFSNPADDTLWYYNSAVEVDVMIHDGTGWKGYQNVANDARGYNLTNTDENGVIISASEPITQSDGINNLVAGDLWLDTSDLENYPRLYRRTATNIWELLDNTDQVSTDGVLFADARWAPNGTTNPITDDIPAITDLLSSNYLDPDAPDYRLYARGTLLFNTRRSGYGVKRFESTWHANADTPPTVVSAWVSNSGIDSDGVPYFGSKAQRNVVVEAMKSAIASSTTLREEQTQFNLIVAPGYPELIQNMVTLNNDRKQTAFIIGDSPLSLISSSTALEAWANNSALATDNGLDGLVSRSEYLAVYYPSGFATNLDGESVVVPASHMMLRTYIRSDNVSYPWFAPAGVRRGLIDNVTSIGYVDNTDSGVFKSIGVTAGLRDILYENEINPLTVLPGVGLVAYGQKTRAATTSAMDRVNVARLVAYLRLVLDAVARPFIFEPNDTITRNQVKSGFESVLNDIVAKRGIYDYLVVCDTTNNTPDRIDRNELWVDIAIKPVKAIEFVYIPVRLVNTGAELTPGA